MPWHLSPHGAHSKSINAQLGVVGILGNHDVSEEIPALERLGSMLINEAMEVRRGRDSAWVIGVDDPHYYGCDDLPAALRDVPAAYKILLVHTPEIISEAEASGVDLYLCGHTHGGQVCLPLIGPIIIQCELLPSLCAGSMDVQNSPRVYESRCGDIRRPGAIFVRRRSV